LTAYYRPLWELHLKPARHLVKPSTTFFLLAITAAVTSSTSTSPTMDLISSTTNEHAGALAAVKLFLSSLGKHQTLVEYINPESFYIKASPGHPLIHSTLAQYVSNTESTFDNFRNNGVETVEVVPLDKRHQEVWVYDNLAAVWMDTETRLDGRVDSTCVNLFTLHKYEKVWKVSAIACEQLRDENIGYEISTDALEIVKPINTLFQHLTNQNWDGFLSILAPGFGASISRPQTTAPSPLVLGPRAFIDRLKEVFATSPGATFEEKIFDFETRRATGTQFAFAWTPFIVDKDDVTQSRGTNVFTLDLGDGRKGGGTDCTWLITGIQDTSRPV